MNESDKEFAARIFGLTMEEVELIYTESVKAGVSFIEVVDHYKVWVQAEAMCEPWVPTKRKVSVFKTILDRFKKIYRVLTLKK